MHSRIEVSHNDSGTFDPRPSLNAGSGGVLDEFTDPESRRRPSPIGANDRDARTVRRSACRPRRPRRDVCRMYAEV